MTVSKGDCKLLAAEGACVAVHGRDEARTQGVVAGIKAAGGHAAIDEGTEPQSARSYRVGQLRRVVLGYGGKLQDELINSRCADRPF